MSILITGGSGQVGRALRRLAPDGVDLRALNSAECDVTDFDQVRRVVQQCRPELIIHAGAMTDVDGCERDPETAWSINALGTQHIAACTAEAGAALVYLSTNYVFDGEADAPYHEFDSTAPVSVYGASKLAGECAVQHLCPRHYVVRTAMVYDETGRNFVNSMLRLGSERPSITVVADQRGNPTYAGDLAEAIWRLVERPAYGVYHLTNEGVASWFEWACETVRIAGLPTVIEAIPAADFPRLARPPANGALRNLAASRLGIRLPSWQDALGRCLTRRAAITPR